MIQSDLLYLTPVSKNDADLFVEIYTDPQIMQHIGPTLNQQAAIELFNKSVNQISIEQPKYLFYVIKRKQNNQKLGIIGLLWNQPKKTSVELGVMIAKSYINKGYAYKATDLLMQYGFVELNLNSIVILCNESNSVANRATQAIGFVNNGIIVDDKSGQRKIKWKITEQNLIDSRKSE